VVQGIDELAFALLDREWAAAHAAGPVPGCPAPAE
jgi:hypothetical protein